MAAPECLARKFGHYPTGNRESLIYFEQKVTQSAPCFRQVLWRVSSKEILRWGWGDPDRKSEVGKLDRKNNSENADREAPKGTNW